MSTTLEQDWEYCQKALVDVSRTFSKPIQLLPERPRIALTLGYLLCRVVDTVEDHPSFSSRQRDELFSRFIAVLDGDLPAREFTRAFNIADDLDAEVRLARSLPQVLRVFGEQSTPTRQATIRWVSEMANGMRVYCRREHNRDLGLSTVDSLADLERYCYFVAGTVGQLITDLFSEFMGVGGTLLEHELRARCESFGIGLQLVNILKDVSDDFERGRCYVPKHLCQSHGFEPEQLLTSDRPHAHEALAPMFECAARHLEQALEYALLIPARQAQLRLFCLLPLWMALETLEVLVGNDRIFLVDQPIKISREAVTRISAECLGSVADDAQLRARHAELSARFQERLAHLRRLDSKVQLAPERYAQA